MESKNPRKNPNDDFEELDNYEEDLEDYEEVIVPHPFSSFNDVIEETLIDDELTSSLVQRN
jgi:hypothetical protein